MSTYTPLVPASLSLADNGTPFSERFDDVYHSADGGLAQARQVFLGGNDLPGRWRGQRQFTLLETGFGLGLNFLATWQAWRDASQRPERLDYIAVELHPFAADDLARLHRRWPELAPLSAALVKHWPILTPGFHRLYLDGGRVCLTLLFGDATRLLRKLRAKVDAFYLDGFAPAKNPELWSEGIFQSLARLSAPAASLATYTVAGAVRQGLIQAGFTVEKRPGFGRKREMLSARLDSSEAPGQHRAPTERRATVIGAGIAGSSLCERLAARGWAVTLIDRHPQPAREASGNLAGLVRPMLSKDDNIASRLARAGFLYAARHWPGLAGDPPPRWFPDGVLQLARNAEHAELQRETVASLGFPTGYVRFVEAEEATQRLHWPVRHGGWLFPAGAHANPPSLCAAALARYPDRIQRRFSHTAVQLERHATGWRVLAADGLLLSDTPILVLAGGAEVTDLAQAADLPIRRVRGQVSLVPAGAMPALPFALCRDGYATPALDGLHCVGASYDGDDERQPRVSCSEDNLNRLEQMLPGAAAGIDPKQLDGRVSFRAVTPDRLPMVGALPDNRTPDLPRQAELADVPRLPGLYGLLGYGSRGLVWAALAAEQLASELDGNPLPLETDLQAAIDPARFRLRAHRRGR